MTPPSSDQPTTGSSRAIRPDVAKLRFDGEGLVPAIIQAASGEVRMVGYMNRVAVEATLTSGFVTFWSRSRKRLWAKGEESGNTLRVLEVRVDCDNDALLVVAEPRGPTCHRGTDSCFDDPPGRADLASSPPTLAWLGGLETLLLERKAGADLAGTYTQRLFAGGVDRIAKKVVEEAGEVVLAAKNVERADVVGSSSEGERAASRAAMVGEAADLLFHLDMLLVDRGVSLLDVVAALRARHGERAGGGERAPTVEGPRAGTGAERGSGSGAASS